MRDYNIINDDLFDFSDTDENMDLKQKKTKKLIKWIKIALTAIMGTGFLYASYKAPNDKEKNTNYLNRFDNF